MTNPVRDQSHFEVLDLVVISTGGGVALQLQALGAAVVPLAPNRLPASLRAQLRYSQVPTRS